MRKRYTATLALLIIMLAMFAPAARADIIPQPDNDFYMRNYDKCVTVQRFFYANGTGGSVSLRAKPGSGSSVQEFENGTVLFIMFTYNQNGVIWGVTQIWETRKNGWIPMDDLLLKYDYISFSEDHESEFYQYQDVVEAVKTIPDLIFWTWPGSGEIDSVLEHKWRADSEHESIFLEGDKDAYKDSDGREWVFIPYLFGRRNAWICLSDPSNMEIPAINPQLQPELWQPGDDHTAQPGGIPLPAVIIILVAALIAVTAVLIRVFWKRKEMQIMAKQAKTYTNEQLLKKVRRLRRLMSVFAPSMTKKSKHRAGKELYIETDEGLVRVLAYNLDRNETLPLFINMHGSGFVMGDAEMDDACMKVIADNMDIKIISIDYSLSPDYPFPKALNECYGVVKYTKEHSDEFGIDPERIAVGGQSAGGNLTAAICLLEHERRQLGIKCAILDYPPLDVYTDAVDKPHPKGSIPVFMSRMFDPCYLNDRDGRKNPLISPVFASPEQLSSFPPVLVITASRDSLCTEGERFRDMLLEAGIDVTHRRFEATHGFNLKPGAAADESWRLIMDFLKTHLL